MTLLKGIPVIHEASIGVEEFREIYDIFQCVCFRLPLWNKDPMSKKRWSSSRRREEDDDDPSGTESQPGQDPSEVSPAKQQHQREILGRNRKRKTLETVGSAVVFGPLEGEILNTIRETYYAAAPRDRESWNIEHTTYGSTNNNKNKNNNIESNKNNNNNSNSINAECATTMSPTVFFSVAKSRDGTSNSNGYCSFVLQDDSNGAVTNFTAIIERLVKESGTIVTTLNNKNNNNNNNNENNNSQSKDFSLPHSLLLPTSNSTKETTTDETGGGRLPSPITVAPHYWIFAGNFCGPHCKPNFHLEHDIIRSSSNNDGGEADWLPGRKEHTDAIEDIDGTFHHQLLGSKRWKLRPTAELRDRCDSLDRALLDRYEIVVEEGDVFVINTGLWWHQTEIPPRGWSVSYAKDMRFRSTEPEGRTDQQDGKADGTPKNNGDDNVRMSDSFSGFDYDDYNDDDDDDDDDDYCNNTATRPATTDPLAQQLAQQGVRNVEVSWASGFIPTGMTMVVADDVVGINCSSSSSSNYDGDNEEDTDAAAFLYYYQQFVPPTIRRTSVEAMANCKLVVKPVVLPVESDQRDDSDESSARQNSETRRRAKISGDSSSSVASSTEKRTRMAMEQDDPKQRPKRRLFRVALESIRDIQEGEEFVLFSSAR